MGISATKGSMFFSSGLAREDPEERNDEVHAQIWLKVIVRLTAADRSDRVGVHVYGAGLDRVRGDRARSLGEEIAARVRRRAGRIRSEERVTMSRYLIDGQRDLFRSASLGED